MATSEAVLRVIPNNADGSYLVIKLEGRQTVGARMPLGGQPLDMTDRIAAFGEGVATVAAAIENLVPAAHREQIEARAAEFVTQGAPEELAHRIARLPWLPTACDIVRIALVCEVGVEERVNRRKTVLLLVCDRNRDQSVVKIAVQEDAV